MDTTWTCAMSIRSNLEEFLESSVSAIKGGWEERFMYVLVVPESSSLWSFRGHAQE
jgi:hypothetical protein